MTVIYAETSFRWGNGVKVNDSMWHPKEPSKNEKVARMRRKGDGPVALAGYKNSAIVYFICQGRPGWWKLE